MASIVVALIALLLTIMAAAKNKVGLTITGSIVTSVAVFIAFPNLLTSHSISIGTTGTWFACAIGVIVMLAAIASKRIHTLFVLVGVLLATWAFFRNIPSLPPAFAHLGPNLRDAWNVLWHAVSNFFKEATGSK